jgi:hypothetical protein
VCNKLGAFDGNRRQSDFLQSTLISGSPPGGPSLAFENWESTNPGHRVFPFSRQGENENSPGCSPPRRTKPWVNVPPIQPSRRAGAKHHGPGRAVGCALFTRWSLSSSGGSRGLQAPERRHTINLALATGFHGCCQDAICAPSPRTYSAVRGAGEEGPSLKAPFDSLNSVA